MVTIEWSRYRARPQPEDALLAARPGLLADVRADRAKGANLPGVGVFFDAIDRLVSAEATMVADVERRP